MESTAQSTASPPGGRLDHAVRMAAWSEADWPAVGRQLEPAAEALVASCRLRPGDDVLDVAAADGNVAVAAARTGGRVVATDLSVAQVAEGQRRCSAAGVAVEWQHADMESLPFEDGSFDVVLSSFGLTFATSPDKALAEMFRVARLDGQVGIVNWSGAGWVGRMADVLQRHLASEPRDNSWGCPEQVSQRMARHGAMVVLERSELCNRVASADAWWRQAQRGLPALVAARNALPPDRFARLGADLVEAFTVHATPDGGGLRYTSGYLLAIARKI